MIRNICLKPGHFHIMWWDPESYSSLLFWSVFFDTALTKGGGWLLRYCQVEAAGQSPQSASVDTIRVAPLLLGKPWPSTRPLRHHFSERWKDVSLLPGGDDGTASPCGPSNTAGGPQLPSLLLQGYRSQLPTCPSWHQLTVVRAAHHSLTRVGVWAPLSTSAGIDGGEAMDVLCSVCGSRVVTG